MKVGVYTLGCKVNTYESEYVINELKKAKFQLNKFDDVNDVYIINTCTVTNSSDAKSRKMIRHARSLNKDACVVVMGCFVEYNKKNFNEIMPQVDIVIGNKDKSIIVDLIKDFFESKKQIINLYDDFDSNFEDMYIEKFNTRTRAFVKVQDGCENFCSYCIIPKVRGKCRSKKLDVAVKEVQTLVNNGYKEIILTGIHTGNYGVDIGTNFAALLKELVKIEGLKRLRISSIEATELTDEVLEVIKNNPVIVDHFHIPIQSGSDNVLKLMNRKYNIEQFKNVVKKIRDFYPLASITTDIISGHPGENKDEFEETLKNVKEINFSKLHVFPYSERRDTPSSKLPQIPEYLKKEETDTLLKLSYELEVAYMKKFLGMKLDVLFETQKDGYSYGHTSNYLSVKVVGNIKSSTFETVTLINVEYPYIFGEVERDTEPVEENDELE